MHLLQSIIVAAANISFVATANNYDVAAANCSDSAAVNNSHRAGIYYLGIVGCIPSSKGLEKQIKLTTTVGKQIKKKEQK